jgi:DNA replicative helicase MCM subunit Mcm2 (Cdc46/Mcm family)
MTRNMKVRYNKYSESLTEIEEKILQLQREIHENIGNSLIGERTKIRTILNIIEKRTMKIEDIIKEAEKQGIAKGETEKIVIQLKCDGMLSEQKNNEYTGLG